MLAGLAALSIASGTSVGAATPNRYVAPHKLGNGSGLQPENACAFPQLESIFKRSSIGTVFNLRTDQGPYEIASTIAISKGGFIVRGWHPDGRSTKAILRGNRTSPFAPGAANGRQLFRLNRGANDLLFEHLHFEDVGNGAFSFGGEVERLTIQDCSAANIYRFIEGRQTTLTDLALRRVVAVGIERAFWRLDAETIGFLCEDVIADSQFNADEPFTSLFVLEGRAQGVYRRCSGMNVIHRNGEKYWNGDIFEQNSDNRNIQYDNCRALNASDGGFDIKGASILTDCSARGAKRNFRLWGNHNLVRPRSEDPTPYGGIGDAVHFGIYADNSNIEITQPIVIATENNRSTVFKIDSSNCRMLINGYENVELIEGQKLFDISPGVTASEIVFDPPLPEVKLQIRLAPSLDGGLLAKDTPIGAHIASVSNNVKGECIFEVKSENELFSILDEQIVVSGDLQSNGPNPIHMTVIARHPKWLVSQSKTIEIRLE